MTPCPNQPNYLLLSLFILSPKPNQPPHYSPPSLLLPLLLWALKVLSWPPRWPSPAPSSSSLSVSRNLSLPLLHLQFSDLAYLLVRTNLSFVCFSRFILYSVSSVSPLLLILGFEAERKKGLKKKKRVHFAEDVVDSRSDGEEFRRKHRVIDNSVYSNSETKVTKKCNDVNGNRGMPANRVALYNGILRDRVAQRLAYSY